LFAVHRCPLGSNFVSWHDAANDLTAIAQALSAKNIVVSRKSGLTPAVSDVVAFADPKGNRWAVNQFQVKTGR
jgi:hypothetical protein